MLLSVHAIVGQRLGTDSRTSAATTTNGGDRAGKQNRPCHCPRDWSIRPAHELRQLGAGVDAQLGERIVDVGFHRMEGKVQLRGDVAVGHALRDQVDHRELGVGEAVPARFCPRLADDATLHT